VRLTGLDLTVIVAYLASLSLLGLYFSRRQVSREEYLLGGRRIHWLPAAGSVVATLLSTLTFLSVPGEMIRYGVAYFTGLLGLPLAIPAVTRILLPTSISSSATTPGCAVWPPASSRCGRSSGWPWSSIVAASPWRR